MNKPLLSDINPVLKVLMLFSFWFVGAILFLMLGVQLIQLFWQVDVTSLDINDIAPEDYQDYRQAFQLNTALNQIGTHLLAALCFFQAVEKEGLGYARFRVKTPKTILYAMVVLGAATLLGGLLVSVFNDWLVTDVFGVKEAIERASERYASMQSIMLSGGTIDMVINIVLLGMLAPICEEVFYRAGLQQILLRTMHSKVKAILLGALIFSVLHFEWNGFLVRFLMGILLGWAFYKTGSIWVGIVLHVVYNTVGVILEYGLKNGWVSEGLINIGAITGIVFALIIISWIRKTYRPVEWPIEAAIKGDKPDDDVSDVQ